MINKRFLNFKTYAEFNRLNEAGEIRPESIVWIADTNQMWTHDTLYSSITEEQARKLAGILTDGAGLKYLTDKLTYEELPDQATVIDIDGKIMDLTTESSNEDILAVFGTLPDFTSLIETVRNSETILNSILVDNDSQVGKVNATILANKTSNILNVIYFDHVKKTFVQLTITETDSVLSCVREEFGSASGGDTTPEVAITEAEPVSGSKEKVYYQVVEDNVDLGVDTDAPADGNMYGRKDNTWQKIEATSQPDLSNYLAKNNTTEFTPTEDYNPATKKYVDDNTINNRQIYTYSEFLKDVNIESSPVDYEKLSKYSNSIILGFPLSGMYEYSSAFIIVDKTGGEGQEFIRLSIYGGGTLGYEVRYLYAVNTKGEISSIRDNKIYIFNDSDRNNLKLGISRQVEDSAGIFSSENTEVSNEFNIYNQKILTESQYAALGEAVNTDGVLYFVTPDA